MPTVSIMERAAQRMGKCRSRVLLWTGFRWLSASFHAPTVAEAESRARAFADVLRPPGKLRAWEFLKITTWLQ